VLDDALSGFNIGQGFRDWVKRVYINTKSCVTNCGFSSINFEISRGVRQGCPLSAYLFIVVAEILAIKIRNDVNIKGINIGNNEIKVVQMADDTTNFIKDIASLKVLLSTLEKFHTYAGLKLNLTKSEALWLGKNRESTDIPLGLKRVKGAKALGIFFSYDAKEMEEKNFTSKLKELKSILGIWGLRDLSTLGRITIFKSLAFSKVIYQCSNLVVPDEVIKELGQIAFNFIWNGKPDKVKRNTIISDYSDGGLKMLDVASFICAQKVMWVKRLLATNNEGSWKIYPQMILSELLGKYSFQCNFNLKMLDKDFPKFYLQLFEAWNKTKEDPKEDPFNLRREILWLNKNIKIGGNVVCYKDWYKKGIIILHDILKEDGGFKTREMLEAEFLIQISIMEYNGLIDAIPAIWKRAIRKMKIPAQAVSNNEQPYIQCCGRLMALGIVCNRDVYWELVKKKQIKPICAEKWCNMFNIEKDDWKTIYTYYASIKDTRMKAFQFKILNNLIPCNLYLKRIGKSDTDKCPSCDILDDIMHYMVECPEVNSIWKQLTRWWKGITEQEVILTSTDIIIGLRHRADKIVKKSQLDDIILAVKWKIYANKQMGEDTSFYQILCGIRNMIEIQSLIFTRKSRSTRHEEIWGEIQDYLT
jgi:hypothetical protein